MTCFVLLLFMFTNCLHNKVYSALIFTSDKRHESTSGFRRNGVFLRLEALKPSSSPTQPRTGDDNSHESYKALTSNSSLPMKDINNTAKPYDLSRKNLESKSKVVNKFSGPDQPNLSKVNFVRPESFTKPTSIPPIGKFLLASSPTSRIKPIQGRLLSFKKPESFGPISEQFVAVDDVAIIEDMPKMPEIDSIDNIFKNDDIDKELKRNFVHKPTYEGDSATKPKFNLQRLRKRKKNYEFCTFLRSSKIPCLVEIKRRLWTQRAMKSKNKILMIKPYESILSSKQLKENVDKVLLGKRRNAAQKVFIPPPPAIQMKKLEPFKKEKEIEDISKVAIKIEKQEPLEGIDKQLQKIEDQPEIQPISDHLIKNEPFKVEDDIDPIKPIGNTMESD